MRTRQVVFKTLSVGCDTPSVALSTENEEVIFMIYSLHPEDGSGKKYLINWGMDNRDVICGFIDFERLKGTLTF